MQQAEALMGQEKYEAALKLLDKAESEDRMNIDVYLTKGVAYANMFDLDNARKEFEKALKLNKQNGLAYFHLGNIAMLEGDRVAGTEFYNNAIASGFDDAQVYFSLGLKYEEEDKDDLAIRNYSKALLKDPERADIRIRKVRLFIKNEKYQEALENLDEMIFSNPDVFEGYHLKYLVLTSLERFKDAENTLNDAIALFPKDPAFVIDKVSLMIAKEQYSEALEEFDRIENDYVLNVDNKHNIAMEKARIYAFLEDMDGTINSLQNARNISKEYDPPRLDLEALYLLMNCYMNNEDYADVLECADELLKAEEEDYYSLAARYYKPLALKLLDRQDESQKLFREAVEYFRAVSLKNPGNVDSYAFRIMALREIGDLEKAYELADYLVTVRDDTPEAYTLRATILQDMGREEEAKADREKAVSFGGILANLPANNQ